MRNVSYCPMCLMLIEKLSGCNHMTCKMCKYEFCWICHRDATEASDHWKEFSLSGCGVSQFDEKESRNNLDILRQKKCQRYCLYAMCFPLVCIGFVAYWISIAFLRKTRGKWPNWVRYPLSFLIFLLGIPLGVVAIPFLIIYGVWRVIHVCCYIPCCKKSIN